MAKKYNETEIMWGKRDMLIESANDLRGYADKPNSISSVWVEHDENEKFITETIIVRIHKNR